ncbi:MAG: DUF1194 domain-containing protein [Rubrimonas sp.]
MRRLPAMALGFAVVASAGAPLAQQASPTQAGPVDVALVLAVDVSLSMDYREQRAQRDGYIEAMAHPAVIDAIVRGPRGRIAVAYMEWGGPWTQRVVIPWRVVASTEDTAALAADLAAAPISSSRGTSITAAIDAAVALLAQSPPADRMVIDISGDGPNNMGGPVLAARDRAAAAGVEINGLPIMLGEDDLTFSIRDLDLYYEQCVISGPTAFVIPVLDLSGFATAIRQKLVLEIAGLDPIRRALTVPPADDGLVVPAQSAIDCEIGERLYERWRRGGDFN